jgi:hypothetical protein
VPDVLCSTEAHLVVTKQRSSIARVRLVLDALAHVFEGRAALFEGRVAATR